MESDWRFISINTTVDFRSSGPKSNGNLTPTDLTFSPQTSFSLILYIGDNIFRQKQIKVIGPFKFVKAKFYCTDIEAWQKYWSHDSGAVLLGKGKFWLRKIEHWESMSNISDIVQKQEMQKKDEKVPFRRDKNHSWAHLEKA